MTRAFSLVEILVAIVVLALGLLGIAAVFPVVVYQQRIASDTIQGVSMERSVNDFLAGHRLLNEPAIPNGNNANPGDRRGWRIVLAQPQWSPLSQQLANSPFGRWSLPIAVADVTQMQDGEGFGFNPATGAMGMGQQGGRHVILSTSERLIPAPFSGAEPRYVWDFAARRIEAGARGPRNQPLTPDLGADDHVQLVIFVRRIDTAIRLRPGTSLSRALVDTGLPASDRRVPAAEDTSGRPTLDGLGTPLGPNFSPISYFSYTVITPDIIVPDTSANFAAALPFAAQVGQRYVDQVGAVHRVVEVLREGNETRVRIDPPIDGRLATVNPGDLPERELQMLFTPQIPVAVNIVTVRP